MIRSSFPRWAQDVLKTLRRAFPVQSGARTLIIVKSPTKAQTLREFLKDELPPPGVTVMSCLGHLRDLPKNRLAVDVSHGFKPEYEVSGGRDQTVAALEKKIAAARRIILATDPDREGEAVAWHIIQLFKAHTEGERLERITFNAVTPEAVREALRHPRPLDLRQVKAAVARRVADRLIGYTVSPALWRGVKGQRGTSAGRVQTAALRILVEHERHTPSETWTLDVEL